MRVEKDELGYILVLDDCSGHPDHVSVIEKQYRFSTRPTYCGSLDTYRWEDKDFLHRLKIEIWMADEVFLIMKYRKDRNDSHFFYESESLIESTADLLSKVCIFQNV